MQKEKIGLVLIALAVSTSGSEQLLVPMALMGAGLWLVRGMVEW